MMRYFWLYADGKTVREIDFNTYQKMARRDYDEASNRHTFLVVWDGGLILSKGRHQVYANRRQVDKVLEEA